MAMGWRIKLVSGEEYDVVTTWRYRLCWTKRPGSTSRVKRKIRRRYRRIQKERIRKIKMIDKEDLYLGIY